MCSENAFLQFRSDYSARKTKAHQRPGSKYHGESCIFSERHRALSRLYSTQDRSTSLSPLGAQVHACLRHDATATWPLGCFGPTPQRLRMDSDSSTSARTKIPQLPGADPVAAEIVSGPENPCVIPWPPWPTKEQDEKASIVKFLFQGNWR